MTSRGADARQPSADRDPPALSSAASVADVLARFAFVDDDEDEAAHEHGEHCTCQLRGR